MSSSTNAFAFFGTAIVAALVASACAMEPKAPEFVSRTADVSDLDLGQRADAKRALYRIKTSAHLACAPKPDNFNYTEVENYKRCVSGAVEMAVLRADIPALTAAYEDGRHTKVAERK